MKKILTYVFATIAILLVGIIGYVGFAMPDVDDPPYVEITPTPDRVERGEYLATHVAVCMDCHSRRDWSQFSGPLMPGSLGKGGEVFNEEMGFPGNFYARNLTPANLGDWTDGEIYRAITVGVNKDGKPLFPLMPYKNYRQMDEEDIYDIIAYLRTLPEIHDEVPKSKADFPMNLILNTIPKKAAPIKRPDSTDRIRYGEYLVNAASCLDCHTPVKRGEPIREFAFTGGREFLMPGGILRSANITPDDSTGIGSWDRTTFVNRFKAFSDTLAHVEEGGFNTIMPWSMYAGMKDSDLEAIYDYLNTLEPVKKEVIAFSAAKK